MFEELGQFWRVSAEENDWKIEMGMGCDALY